MYARPRTWLPVNHTNWVSLDSSKRTLIRIFSGVSLSSNVYRFASWEHLESICLINFIIWMAIDPGLQTILYASTDMFYNWAFTELIKLSLLCLWLFGTVSSIRVGEKMDWKWSELWKSVIGLRVSRDQFDRSLLLNLYVVMTKIISAIWVHLPITLFF